MGDISGRRRGHGEDAIYFDADKNRHIGAISLGFGPGGKRTTELVYQRELRPVITAGAEVMDTVCLKSGIGGVRAESSLG
jgi:hypothetical protein